MGSPIAQKCLAVALLIVFFPITLVLAAYLFLTGRRNVNGGGGIIGYSSPPTTLVLRRRLGQPTSKSSGSNVRRKQEATAVEQKQRIADALRRAMDRGKVSKTDLAKGMNTSRSVVDSILDGDDPALTLVSLARVSAVLGLQLEVRLRAR